MAPRFNYAYLPDQRQHCARDVELHVSETSDQEGHDQPAAHCRACKREICET